MKSGPAIKRANYPPSHKCAPSNIFFLRSLREHSKRTRALAYASCISRRRARIMPRKSPRMHIIYGSGSCIESARGARHGGGGDKGRLIKLRVPRDVAFTRPNLPRKHICSGKVPILKLYARPLLPFLERDDPRAVARKNLPKIALEVRSIELKRSKIGGDGEGKSHFRKNPI